MNDEKEQYAQEETEKEKFSEKQSSSYLDDMHPGLESSRQLVEYFSDELLVLQDFPHFHNSDNRRLD